MYKYQAELHYFLVQDERGNPESLGISFVTKRRNYGVRLFWATFNAAFNAPLIPGTG